ncbi:endonuclease/exonuclease/phosphatase family protein [Pseudonocardia nigra]|uniref:endonuclease/exonuclease/phosphatase family protein n=1 Tax=Pseudonocardia nigra TaxID=1921578 RepID=UPI001C5D3589|nr:endonuclease/exonuclease/phosphatase family protein [Pseudonocardia nigra]
MSARRTAARCRRLGAAAALGGMAAALVVPDRLRLDHRFPGVDVVAWRPHTTAATLAAAAFLATRRRSRPGAALVGAVGLGGAAAVAGRAITRRAPEQGPEDLRILSLNALHGRADTGELATVIEREVPDFVVLPEAGCDFRDKLLPLVEVLGYRAWTSTEPGVRDGHSVTLLAGGRAGDVRVRIGTGMRYPHLEVTGGILGRRTLYAVHPTAPMGPRRTALWRKDLALIAQWCRAPIAPIVAGDFNSTLDHSVFRAAMAGCRSAAAGSGQGLVATYPSALPRWLGIQIDHVLVPPRTVTTRFDVVDVAGTDHRAVLAGVRLGS